MIAKADAGGGVLELIQGLGSLGQTGMTVVVGFFIWWFNKRMVSDGKDKDAMAARLSSLEDRQYNGITKLVTDSAVALETSRGAIDRNTIALTEVANVIRKCAGPTKPSTPSKPSG